MAELSPSSYLEYFYTGQHLHKVDWEHNNVTLKSLTKARMQQLDVGSMIALAELLVSQLLARKKYTAMPLISAGRK